jgi:hypothetical protein
MSMPVEVDQNVRRRESPMTDRDALNRLRTYYSNCLARAAQNPETVGIPTWVRDLIVAIEAIDRTLLDSRTLDG